MHEATPRLALVDDEESVRKAVGRLLLSARMEVAAFASGAAFLQAACASPFDCLILDLHMPEMSGFEVLERMSSSGMKTPVVVITGDDTAENRARVSAAGIAACLAKPVDATLLFEAIHAAMRR
jgi:FixJ family two-component response regulator